MQTCRNGQPDEATQWEPGLSGKEILENPEEYMGGRLRNGVVFEEDEVEDPEDHTRQDPPMMNYESARMRPTALLLPWCLVCVGNLNVSLRPLSMGLLGSEHGKLQICIFGDIHPRMYVSGRSGC